MPYIPKACGFIVFRDGELGPEYLLLQSRKWDEPGFPKGHVDDGESELETAHRETYEETGLEEVAPIPRFRRELTYPIERKGKTRTKTTVYFLSRVHEDEVRLSSEHTDAAWYPFELAWTALPHDGLRVVLREAALHVKDPGLFEREPATEAEADGLLCALPGASAGLLGHLRGGARLARIFAEALEAAGAPVRPEAAAAGTILHDLGRVLGDHAQHQMAGLRHLRGTPLAPYGFACISHFTKGASRAELEAAGVAEATLDEFEEASDLGAFGVEEQCAALADACMRGPDPVPPARRFADLRARYDAAALIDLQERRTEEIRASFTEILGRDPLSLAGLAG